MRVFLVVGSIVVVGLAAFSIEAVRFLTTPEYNDAWRLVPILALAILMGSLYTFVPGLTVRNLTTRFALINIVTAAVSLSMVVILLRAFGTAGAAIGAVVGATCGFVMHALASQAVYRMPVDWPRLGAALAITTLAILACSITGAPGVTSLAVRLLVFAVGTAALVSGGLTGEDRSLAWRVASSGFGIGG